MPISRKCAPPAMRNWDRMPKVSEQVLIPHSADNLYELVRDIRRYPEFIKWIRTVAVDQEQGSADGPYSCLGTASVHFKGFDEPVRVHAVSLASGAQVPPPEVADRPDVYRDAKARAKRPTIVVMPFTASSIDALGWAGTQLCTVPFGFGSRASEAHFFFFIILI